MKLALNWIGVCAGCLAVILGVWMCTISFYFADIEVLVAGFFIALAGFVLAHASSSNIGRIEAERFYNRC